MNAYYSESMLREPEITLCQITLNLSIRISLVTGGMATESSIDLRIFCRFQTDFLKSRRFSSFIMASVAK